MATDNAYFRKVAGHLVDALKRPENADILDTFTHYDVRKEGGWSNFDLILPQEFLEHWKRQGWAIPIPALTPEQCNRWMLINRECDIQGSGASDGIVWLVAQGMLGRLDVYEEE